MIFSSPARSASEERYGVGTKMIFLPSGEKYVRTDSTSLAQKSSEVPPDKSWQKVCENRQIWGINVG
jgi:hypothetical protein